MIVEKIESVPTFDPVNVKITFQTQKEIEAFYALFNHPKLAIFLGNHGILCSQIRNSLGKYDNFKVYSELRDLIYSE